MISVKTYCDERSIIIHVLDSKQKNGKGIKQRPLKFCDFSKKKEKQKTEQLEIYCMLYWLYGKKIINRGQTTTKRTQKRSENNIASRKLLSNFAFQSTSSFKLKT